MTLKFKFSNRTYIVGLGLTLFGLGHFAGLSLSPRASFVFLFHSRPHNGQYLVKKEKLVVSLTLGHIRGQGMGGIRTNPIKSPNRE